MDKQKRIPLKVTVLRVMKTEDVLISLFPNKFLMLQIAVQD